jgi:hypothetical protein
MDGKEFILQWFGGSKGGVKKVKTRLTDGVKPAPGGQGIQQGQQFFPYKFHVPARGKLGMNRETAQQSGGVIRRRFLRESFDVFILSAVPRTGRADYAETPPLFLQTGQKSG